MRRVVIESPLAGDTARNKLYARMALRDCLARGEAPLASHLLYTQVLDDQVPDERTLGINAGFAWNQMADAVVVYTGLGITPGMELGIADAASRGTPVEYRDLTPPPAPAAL